MISLILYILVFLITILSTYVVEKKPEYYSTGKLFQYSNNELQIDLLSLKRKLWFIPIFLVLIIVTGFRYYVGTDFENYQILYNAIVPANFNEVLRQTAFNEPLYVFLNKVAALIFGNNSVGIFLLSAVITYIFLYRTLVYFKLKYNIKIWQAILVYCLYFFPLTLNIQRQMIAVSIILYAITKLSEGKMISFVGYTIGAMGFHTSSGICLIFLLIYIFKEREKLLNIFVIITPAFTDMVFSLVVKIPFLSKYFSRYIVNKQSFSVTSLLEVAILLIPLFINKKEIVKKYPDISFLFTIALLNIPLIFLSAYQHWFSRVMYFITILQVLLIPLVISVQTKKKKVGYLLFYISFLIIYFILKFYIIGTEEIFPYKTRNILF